MNGVGEYIDPEALQDQQGSASALWNSLSRGIYGFIIPDTRTFAVFGSSGGVDCNHSIIGGTSNPADQVLYLALDRAGQVGDYDRPPLILAFKLAP